MNGLLSKSIRDFRGRLHKRDERVSILCRVPRADFDPRPLLCVPAEWERAAASAPINAEPAGEIRQQDIRSPDDATGSPVAGFTNTITSTTSALIGLDVPWRPVRSPEDLRVPVARETTKP